MDSEQIKTDTKKLINKIFRIIFEEDAKPSTAISALLGTLCVSMLNTEIPKEHAEHAFSEAFDFYSAKKWVKLDKAEEVDDDMKLHLFLENNFSNSDKTIIPLARALCAAAICANMKREEFLENISIMFDTFLEVQKDSSK